jgi:hypothetical protein
MQPDTVVPLERAVGQPLHGSSGHCAYWTQLWTHSLRSCWWCEVKCRVLERRRREGLSCDDRQPAKEPMAHGSFRVALTWHHPTVSAKSTAVHG